LVQEGTAVAEGDPIVELVDNDPDIMARLSSEKDALEKRLKTLRSAAATSQMNVERQKHLFESGISARRAYEQAELEYARYLTDEANAIAELSRIEVRISRQGSQVVRAPRSGTILKRLAGQESVMVKAGETLAVLVPTTQSRAVELWVSGNDVPLLRVGQEARLQFEGWPAIQFSGWPGLAAGTFRGEVGLIDAADDGTGRFRVLVRPLPSHPWPDGLFLRQGLRCNGWVLLSEVPLAFELWRRFNGFPQSFPVDQGEKKK
jgi:multidrug resistance efflux pump